MLVVVRRCKYDIDISPCDGVEGLRRREFIIDVREVMALGRAAVILEY